MLLEDYLSRMPPGMPLVTVGGPVSAPEYKLEDLCKAAKDGCFEKVTELFDKVAGIDLNSDDYSHNPILYAAENGHLKEVEFLLGKADGSPVKGLHSAVFADNYAVVMALLDYGVDVNYKRCGATALPYAVQSGNLDIVRELVSRKADVNAKDGLGRCCLKIAIHYNHPIIAEFLLKEGANPEILGKITPNGLQFGNGISEVPTWAAGKDPEHVLKPWRESSILDNKVFSRLHSYVAKPFSLKVLAMRVLVKDETGVIKASIDSLPVTLKKEAKKFEEMTVAKLTGANPTGANPSHPYV